MEKMKRLAAVLIALCLAFSMTANTGAGAFAAGEADDNGTIEFSESGITLKLPMEFLDINGVIIPDGGYDVTGGAGIYVTGLLYFAISREDFDKYIENTNPSEEEFEKFWNSSAYLVTVISGDNGLTFDEINAYADGELDSSSAKVFCTVGDCTHFLYDLAESLPEDTDPVFLEEFETLKGLTGDLLAGSEFGEPFDPIAGMIGRKIQFETTDTEGNAVSSEELFGSHEITMVNIWASWCGFCIDEMEELEAINGRLAEKNCAVVGLLSDGDEEAALASGLETLKEKGVTYVNILPPENMDDLFMISAYPTTFFVDREGVIVGAPIVGARVDQYEPMLEAILAGDQSAIEALLDEPSDEEAEEGQIIAYVKTNDDSVYRVIVIDEDGNPVSGVMVQFCSDSACMLGETDETGTVEFKEPMGLYSVHILKAPAEYIVEETEYWLEAFADLTIYLFRP